jgi:hypothetical protein
MSRLWSETSSGEPHNKLSDNMTSSRSADNLKLARHSDEAGMAKIFYGQHFPENQSILSSSTPNLSESSATRLSSSLRPPRKCFYLPEDRIHSNELVQIRQHFDKSYDKQRSSGMPNTRDSGNSERSRIGATKNHDFELKGTQKSSRIGASSMAAGFNESSAPTRATALALIKNNNSVSCGGNDWKCGGNEAHLMQTRANEASPSTSSFEQKAPHGSGDLKAIKSQPTTQVQAHQRQHNLILMNDDCKLLRVQDEQASTSSLCADEYCKDARRQHDKTNETSTTNSEIDRSRLRLDMFLYKELQAVQDYSPKPQSFSDSFSSDTSSDTEARLIDTRQPASGRLFTDGEYIYGPYDFDLFTNEFYQFRVDDDKDDDSRQANDDEAKTHDDDVAIINSEELLKNHDEVDNNAEVSFVRAGGASGISRNRNRARAVNIEINVTECCEEDELDRKSTGRNFNYDVCGRSMIDSMEEGGDDDVSSRDLHGMTRTRTDDTRRFNYERAEIAKITDSNEDLDASLASTKADDEKRKFIFVGSDAGTRLVDRPQLHPSDAKRDELDNCFSSTADRG